MTTLIGYLEKSGKLHMATDRQSTRAERITQFDAKKLKISGGWLVGFCGTLSLFSPICEAIRTKKPTTIFDVSLTIKSTVESLLLSESDRYDFGLLVGRRGELYDFTASAGPIDLKPGHFRTNGTGAPIAQASLLTMCGLAGRERSIKESMKRAIQITSLIDPYTGSRSDYMSIGS